MFEVEVREVPERMLLIARRGVTIDQLSGFATEQVARFGNGTLPVLPGIGGAPFLVFHGEVDADSDGPVEWCRPIPAEQAGRSAVGSPTSRCGPIPRIGRRTCG